MMAQRVGELERKVGGFSERFDAIDQKFTVIDERFDAIDRKFEAVDKKFDAVDKRFDAVDQRLDAMDRRLEALPTRADLRTFVEKMASQVTTAAEGYGEPGPQTAPRPSTRAQFTKQPDWMRAYSGTKSATDRTCCPSSGCSASFRANLSSPVMTCQGSASRRLPCARSSPMLTR